MGSPGSSRAFFLKRPDGPGRLLAKKQSKVIQYPRRGGLSIGAIIFVTIMLYVLIGLIRYAATDHVAGYEVRTGSLSANTVYKGIALRKEQIVESPYSGYVNYFTRESDRLGAGKLACTVDESGTVSDRLGAEAAGESIFSDQDYRQMESDIIGFTSEFSEQNFSPVYDFKSSYSSTVQSLTSNSILMDITSIGDGGAIHYCNTPVSGYIIYSTDGYEDKTFETLTLADFDYAGYQKKPLSNNELVTSGSPVYKLATDEHWSIAIQVDSEETAQELLEMEVVRVRFLKNQLESNAVITGRVDQDGQNYINLAFTNSMMTFCTDRFIDIELITSARKGLKLPLSALINGSFFIVPEEYVTIGTGSQQGVLRRTMDKDGNLSSEFVAITPYSLKGGYYYVDMTVLGQGDVLLKPDSSETMQVSATDQLTGVYNINAGYADFREVTIEAQNEEYAIVQPNSTYALREFDFIALDAGSVRPGEFIYE